MNRISKVDLLTISTLHDKDICTTNRIDIKIIVYHKSSIKCENCYQTTPDPKMQERTEKKLNRIESNIHINLQCKHRTNERGNVREWTDDEFAPRNKNVMKKVNVSCEEDENFLRRRWIYCNIFKRLKRKNKEWKR